MKAPRRGTMKRISSALVVLFFASAALPKENPRITIQVVGSQTNERRYTNTTPGPVITSQTTCSPNRNGSVTGPIIDPASTTLCATTSQTGAPPVTLVNSIKEEHVRAIMPDGAHVTLWCEGGVRRCDSLRPGNYSAEVKGNTVWMYPHDPSGKEHKIKYKALRGDW